jgi:hypothetical protein
MAIVLNGPMSTSDCVDVKQIPTPLWTADPSSHRAIDSRLGRLSSQTPDHVSSSKPSGMRAIHSRASPRRAQSFPKSGRGTSDFQRNSGWRPDVPDRSLAKKEKRRIACTKFLSFE